MPKPGPNTVITPVVRTTPLIPENVSYLMGRLDDPILKTLEEWNATPTPCLRSCLIAAQNLKAQLNDLRKHQERKHRPKDFPNSRFVVPE